MDHKIKIALADDHAMLRKSLKVVIDSMPEFEVVADEDNGQLLLEKLASTRELPDICIVDINMPRMNGYETTAALKKKFPDLKVLALSMYDNEQSIIRMLRAGASGYLLKDSEPEELKRALIEIFDHDFYQSDIVRGQMLRSINREKDLSENELQFLKLCCTELTYKEIAEKMFKSPRTIDGYRDQLFVKLGATTRSGLVMYAIKTGLVPINGKDDHIV
ncbi:MAG TPA: response regulator transcription factor [Flavipsychrobacter sp.]|nr:response regulator transcription factor [Flavipsychrobacter sp.]